MVTSADIANQALQMMGGNQPLLTGNWPNFAGGNTATVNAANALYGACVATVMRQFGWDFARHTAVLVPSGGVAPFPWSLEYLYPSDAIEVWELSPTAETDPNDPLPVNYVVANAVVTIAGVQTQTQARVIHTDLAAAQAIYNNKPNENIWDALFREAAVRLMSSEFAMAIAGKPDTSSGLLQSGSAFEQIAETRRD